MVVDGAGDEGGGGDECGSGDGADGAGDEGGGDSEEGEVERDILGFPGTELLKPCPSETHGRLERSLSGEETVGSGCSPNRPQRPWG